MSVLITEYQTRIENVLDIKLAAAGTTVSPHLLASMRYSTLGGGKRFRALLAYAASLAVDAPLDKVDNVAAALECIHAYSLIHDDLPAMDDDALRRGKATNHIEFDEATAILAGDGLLTYAFELVSDESSKLNDSQARKISHKLAQCAGQNGMVGGQMLDMLATNQALSQTELENIHLNKTGALIQAAVLCGAYCSDSVSNSQLAALDSYAVSIGLAFQVIDDVLDIESNTQTLGKQSGADQLLGKSTYPSLIGLEQSKQLAKKLYQQSIASIDTIGDNNKLLTDLAALVINRVN